jgi:hypothetical protein
MPLPPRLAETSVENAPDDIRDGPSFDEFNRPAIFSTENHIENLSYHCKSGGCGREVHTVRSGVLQRQRARRKRAVRAGSVFDNLRSADCSVFEAKGLPQRWQMILLITRKARPLGNLLVSTAR